MADSSGGVGVTTGDIEHARAWILTCESWMAQGAYIVLPINPEQLSFDLAVRTSNDQARALQVICVWRNYDRDGTSFVLPTINLTVNSGYIVPSFDPSVITTARTLSTQKAMMLNPNMTGILNGEAARQAYKDEYENDLKDGGFLARIPDQDMTRDYIGTGLYKRVGLALQPNPVLTDSAVVTSSTGNLPGLYSEANKHIPIGIQNLYAMFSLMDERRIRKTNETEESSKVSTAQTENRAVLVISTPAWPRLVCYGWFGEDGLKFSESADEPTSFNMDFSFIVTDTEPRLGYGSWEQLASTYASEVNGGASTLDVAMGQQPDGESTASVSPVKPTATALEDSDQVA